MNALEKLVDLLIMSLLLFIVPLLFFRGQLRRLQVASISQNCENFLQTVSVMGEITPPVIKELTDELFEKSCIIQSLERKRTLYFPVEDGVTERRISSGFPELLDEVKKKGSAYMEKGDCLQLQIEWNEVVLIYQVTIRSRGISK